MTLPAGLATIAARLDDCPADRGALAFCRAAADRKEAETRLVAVPDRMIADHVALAIGQAYRSRDVRAIVFRQHGAEILK